MNHDIDMATLERLVPATDVLELLAREYDRRGVHGGFEGFGVVEACQRAAIDALLVRLADGALKATAAACYIDSTQDTEVPPPGRVLADGDYYVREEWGWIPVDFWRHFADAGSNARTVDLVTGDFRFSYLDCEYSRRDGRAFNVHFDRTGLPCIAVPSSNAANPYPVTTSETKSANSAVTAKGRKPANWWPDFAEELALWCLHNDPPDGTGTDGQSDIIKAVQDRMAERGVEVPGRETVRPVVNAVLLRYRGAGN